MSDTTSLLFGLLCGGGLALVFGGIGAFLIYQSIQQRKKAGASQSWPSTAGQITHASISHSTSTDSEGDTTDSYSPHLSYTYQVLGSQYTGDKISIGFQQSFSNRNKAAEILAHYPEAAQVAVFYNPQNPAEAVLERRASGSTVALVIGIIFAIVGVCTGCGTLVGILFSLAS